MADDRFRLDTRNIESQFIELCRRFKDLFVQDLAVDKTTPLDPLWDLREELDKLPADQRRPPFAESFLDSWTERLRERIETARHYLPLAYQEAYVAPLLRNLDRIVRSNANALDAHNTAETMAGAVAQHLPSIAVRQPLRQFLAVVSNLYRSFLAPDKRISAEVPLAAPALPPLVAFHHGKKTTRPFGPAVFTSAMTRLLCGSDVAVVVMPATYYRAPLTWVPLAHEASGHGVLQADPNLLPDLVAGVRALFGGGPLSPGETPDKNQALGLLWSYWVEETASDVYGLLNVGPAFALNLAAFLAAQRGLRHDFPAEAFPMLDVKSGDDPRTDLGVHPVDLLRLHVAIGVIENLAGLSAAKVKFYVKLLRKIAALCGRNAWKIHKPDRTIVIKGRVEVERERSVRLNLKLSITEAAESARRVGAFIASTRLGALGNRTVQDLETWDEADELVARSICSTLLELPKVRRWEMVDGELKEMPLEIQDALLDLDPTEKRIEQIIDALKADQFDALSDDEKAALNLELLTPQLIEALKVDRIEAFAADSNSIQAARGLNLDRIEALGDDGQLLAGATLAALSDPSSLSYKWINRHLAYALNRSYQHDPIMGFAGAHGMFDGGTSTPSIVSLPPNELERDALEQAADTGAGAKPLPFQSNVDRQEPAAQDERSDESAKSDEPSAKTQRQRRKQHSLPGVRPK